MGNLKNSDLVEVAFWLLIAAIFFSVSFNFNQPIEIYKFGATGWPRVILILIGLAALGNLYHSLKNGSKIQKGRVGASEAPDQVHYKSVVDYLKTAWILLIPLLYAISLKPVGFYFGTPFFISLVMLAWGERRVKFILLKCIYIVMNRARVLLISSRDYINTSDPGGHFTLAATTISTTIIALSLLRDSIRLRTIRNIYQDHNINKCMSVYLKTSWKLIAPIVCNVHIVVPGPNPVFCVIKLEKMGQDTPLV